MNKFYDIILEILAVLSGSLALYFFIDAVRVFIRYYPHI